MANPIPPAPVITRTRGCVVLISSKVATVISSRTSRIIFDVIDDKCRRIEGTSVLGYARGMKRTAPIVVLALSLVTVAATACGGSDSSSTPTTARQKNAAITTAPGRIVTTMAPVGNTVSLGVGGPTTTARKVTTTMPSVGRPPSTCQPTSTAAPQVTTTVPGVTTVPKSGC